MGDTSKPMCPSYGRTLLLIVTKRNLILLQVNKFLIVLSKHSKENIELC